MSRFSNNHVRPLCRFFSQTCQALARVIALTILSGLFVMPFRAQAAEPSLTEYQVKSLFLMNFARYVDWPPASFAAADAPIVIGLYGDDKFSDTVKETVAGREIGGRRLTIQLFQAEKDLEKCHILFISDSKKNRLNEILVQVKALPVLTVGETDRFLEQGGMINFVKKEGRVRLEINLTPALQAKLEISSKLLRVADVVQGKER